MVFIYEILSSSNYDPIDLLSEFIKFLLCVAIPLKETKRKKIPHSFRTSKQWEQNCQSVDKNKIWRDKVIWPLIFARNLFRAMGDGHECEYNILQMIEIYSIE